MVSEIRKQQLRDSVRTTLQARWGAVQPDAVNSVLEDLRARTVDEGLLNRPAEALAAVKQSLSAHSAYSAQEIPHETIRDLSRERDAGAER